MFSYNVLRDNFAEMSLYICNKYDKTTSERHSSKNCPNKNMNNKECLSRYLLSSFNRAFFVSAFGGTFCFLLPNGTSRIAHPPRRFFFQPSLAYRSPLGQQILQPLPTPPRVEQKLGGRYVLHVRRMVSF